MNEYWYLCGNTGVIKYAGEFVDFDECDDHLTTIGAYAIWIFTGTPKIEAKHEYI
jgi:hypothetical protein